MVKTLYIGIGGLGIRAVTAVKARKADGYSFYAVLDSDIYDLKQYFDKDVLFVNTYIDAPVEEQTRLLIPKYNIGDWFTRSGDVLPATIDEHRGTRIMGRLEFLYSMEYGEMKPLEELLKALIADIGSGDRLQVNIVTSLIGKAGSGYFIQLALWLRKQFKESGFSDFGISGFFVGHEVLLNSYEGLKRNMRRVSELRANTYAALKELCIITKIKKSGDASFLPQGISLDGLFDSSREQDGKDVYDSIYIYDGFDACCSYEEYVDVIARFLSERFPAIAGDTERRIRDYLDGSPVLKEAYHCAVCMETEVHLDMRWEKLFEDQ